MSQQETYRAEKIIHRDSKTIFFTAGKNQYTITPENWTTPPTSKGMKLRPWFAYPRIGQNAYPALIRGFDIHLLPSGFTPIYHVNRPGLIITPESGISFCILQPSPGEVQVHQFNGSANTQMMIRPGMFYTWLSQNDVRLTALEGDGANDNLLEIVTDDTVAYRHSNIYDYVQTVKKLRKTLEPPKRRSLF